MMKLTDDDVAAIASKTADMLEERFTGNMQKAVGKWVFSVIWKAIATALLAYAAYTYGKDVK